MSDAFYDADGRREREHLYDLQDRIKNVLNMIKTREQQFKQINEDIDYAKNVLAELLTQNMEGKYKIAQRPARVGEKIMIVNGDYISLGDYHAGEIYTALARYDGRVYIEKTYRHNGDNVWVPDRDYVVLEAVEET